MTSDSITSLPLFAQPLPGQDRENGRDGSATPKVAGLQHPRHAADTSVDWSLVAALRARASEQLSQAVAANRGRLDKAAQEELGRSIVLDLVESPVADSDEELIDFLVFLASRSEVNARGFSEAQPRLHLRLDGGARLAAAAWVTPKPSVVIRRHRLMQVTLDDLVARQTLTPVAASS